MPSEVATEPETERTARPTRMLIGGDWVDSADGRAFAVLDPATGRHLASVPRAGAVDVDLAVGAAGTAFEDWRRVDPRLRARMLWHIADTLEERHEQIARIVSSETGNAIRTQSRPEVGVTIEVFRYFAGLTGEVKGQTVPLGETLLSYSRREPLGVVGAIVPWNSPVLLSAIKIAAALASGNTVVLKAAEDAPFGVLELAAACQEYLPAGVLNVLTGYGQECGAPLAGHPQVRKLSFTGSTEVGKSIMAAAADRIVPVSLELGGKSAQIVHLDANEDWVVEGVATAMRFTRQGQSCSAGSRLFLHEAIYEPFLERLVAEVGSLRVGDPLDEATDVGSIINEKQYRRVCSYIEAGLELDGSRLLLGGMPNGAEWPTDGYFVHPTILADVSNDSRLAQDEIFGPVLCVIPWSDEEEAIRMANDTRYGLNGFVWTRDWARAVRMAHALEAGWVQINRGGGQLPGMSYGGYKESGLGREFSLEGMLDSFTQVKFVMGDYGR